MKNSEYKKMLAESGSALPNTEVVKSGPSGPSGPRPSALNIFGGIPDVASGGALFSALSSPPETIILKRKFNFALTEV